ncbi:uncharacterized protein [Henckelia pumila]|uniref:uncharacterized protein n=1 Tax=Henckelia pumila TaxID=405737 RepID=UPI003C6E3F47
MENIRWEQKMNALTHILTTPTTSPPLHSQLFIATQIPCYLNWDYPPYLLCHQSSAAFPPPLLKWAISRFFERISRPGIHQTSWRSRCPFQLPPPLVLAKGVEEARWSEEEKREYVWKRFTRKRLGSNVNPWIPILLPNMLLFSLLLWDPIPYDG